MYKSNTLVKVNDLCSGNLTNKGKKKIIIQKQNTKLSHAQ